MKITVVRHGETDGNLARIVQSHTDGMLTERGVLQARLVAENLRNDNFDFIICSSLGRCKETATIIAAEHPNTKIFYSDLLRERNLGVYEGRPWDDVPWGSIEGSNLNKKLPEGESWVEVEKRVADCLNELLKTYPDGKLLIVTHGGVIKAMDALLSDVSLRQAVDAHVTDNGSTHNWEILASLSPKTVQ